MVTIPSPYGVSFILMVNGYIGCWIDGEEFPSPYGVSFILMELSTLPQKDLINI